MLVDIHTNLMWYPDHYSEEFVSASWEAKKAKMRRTADVHCAVDDEGWKHNFDSRPEQLLEATRGCMAFGFSGRGLDGTHAAADLLPTRSRRTWLGVRWPWRRITHRSL